MYITVKDYDSFGKRRMCEDTGVVGVCVSVCVYECLIQYEMVSKVGE